eukprot:2644394-Rhodomonas_salina.1
MPGILSTDPELLRTKRPDGFHEKFRWARRRCHVFPSSSGSAPLSAYARAPKPLLSAYALA